MVTLHVDRLRAVYHLPPSRVASRARLDRVLERVRGEALDRALDALGLPDHELVCIRRVHAPLRLSLDASDAALTHAWSDALAAQIRLALAVATDHEDIVRYTSRAAALVDVVTSAARSDLRRAWAWRSLGLWSPGSAPDAVLAALEAEPALCPAALDAALHAGAMPWLRRVWSTAHWRRLAASVLRARRDDEARDEDPTTQEELRAVSSRAARIARTSALVSWWRAHHDGAPRETLDAVAALAAAATEPAAVTMARRDVAALVHLLSVSIAPLSDDATRPSVVDARDPATTRRAAQNPTTATRARTTGDAPSIGTCSEGPAPQTAPEAPLRAREEAPSASRARGETWCGGLLFLVHLVDALEIPARLVGDPALGVRPLRWTLHRLAMRLAPIAGDDPAALAFAGLGPTATPPSRDEAPATADEDLALDALAAAVRDALAARLPRVAREPHALLAWVCRRHAVVLADPGWIELHLSLDDVSTDLRRAGLDLDPNFVSWLGVVVRFVYA